MKRIFIPLIAALAAVCISTSVARASVVRPAPDIAFTDVSGKGSSVRSLRGQPVVIVFGRSPTDGAFRKQVKFLEELYRRFAGRDTVFVAAFTAGEGRVKSNIPFVVARDGAGAAAAYGVPGKFAVGIVGKDGNLDILTERFCSADRVREIMDNSYVIQSAQRKN